MLFKECWKQYFDVFCDGVITYDCSQEYSIISKKHFLSLQDMELKNIKPIHIQECIKTAINYSSNRQRKVYYLLHRVLDEAVINDLLEQNPVDKIHAPKKIHKNITAFNTSEVNKILSDVDMNDTALLIAIDLHTGLRRGELLALEWKHVHLDEMYIEVCQTLVRQKDGLKIVQTTKGRKDRNIPLNPYGVALFKMQMRNNLNNSFVFTGKDTLRPMSFKAYSYRYKKYITKKILDIYPHKN